MSETTPELLVQIVRFVDDAFPGWVECEFADADGKMHTLNDKYPIFTALMLDRDSIYPQPGCVRCEVLVEWQDAVGRTLSRINTARPWGVESTEGLSEFVVASCQILNKSESAPVEAN